jgi:hypothetical protein
MFRNAACIALEPRIETYRRKRSLRDKLLAGLGVLLNIVSDYIHTPFLLVACVTCLVLPSVECACSTCKPGFDTSPRKFIDRLCLVLPILCFAPYGLPEKLWRMAFPPPCKPNICILQRYISPPQPWYHGITGLCRPLQLQSSRPCMATPFPFLRLPLELRNQIYLYASHTHSKHTIQVELGRRDGECIHCSLNHNTRTTCLADNDAHNPSVERGSEDAVSYRLSDNGIIAIYGAPPSGNLMLVNKQVYAETRDI